MNETIKRQLEHKSIREFIQEKIGDETVKTLLEVANRTSTSMGMQSYSVIRITDAQVKAQIAKVCMQDYVNRLPEFWIFIVDLYRNAAIAAEQDCHNDSRCDSDRFFQGFTDACLAAQNVVVAAESLGMGAVYFGSVLNDTEEVIKILDLPEYTFPVVGLGFGKPNQDPQMKPRMDMNLKVFENKYNVYNDYSSLISEYDKEMTTYYDLRNAGKAMDTFSKQVVDKLENPMEKRSKMLNTMRRQGFDFQLEYIPENEIKSMLKKAPKNVEEHVFEVSKSGLKVDTKLIDLFDKYPFIKEYLININPKFNKLNSLSANKDFVNNDINYLANLGEMPADSLIYMIESRISEEM